LTAAASALSSSAPRVAVKWVNNATDPAATVFTLQRAADAAFTTGVVTRSLTGANVTTYTDSTVLTHTTYYYRVRAEDAAAYSTWSNTVSATTPGRLPLAPTSLRVLSSTTTTISIAWTNNSPANGALVTGIRVQTSTAGSGGPWSTRATLAKNVSSYKLVGLTTGKTYWMRLVVFNADGSTVSAVISRKI
jgi:hypothetical protein